MSVLGRLTRDGEERPYITTGGGLSPGSVVHDGGEMCSKKTIKSSSGSPGTS